MCEAVCNRVTKATAEHVPSAHSAQEYIAEMTDTFALASWRLTMRGKELFRKPRIAALRSIMLNHWYHHPGQLSVYFRLARCTSSTSLRPQC
ncbi:MAG: hypothetical protein WA477_16190 [Candidatus Sulfotelmatobacter sp.]